MSYFYIFTSTIHHFLYTQDRKRKKKAVFVEKSCNHVFSTYSLLEMAALVIKTQCIVLSLCTTVDRKCFD